MSDREFYVLGKTQWVGPVSSADVYKRAGEKAVKGTGPFTIRKNHKPVGKPRTRRLALLAFQWQVQSGKVGDVESLRNAKGDEVIRVREAQAAVRVIDTTGNDKVDKYWTALKAEFPDVTYAGAYVCKDIAGTSEHSQHSYGNAIDNFRSTMDKLETQARWVVAHADEYDVERVIVANREWQRGRGWFSYTGDYHYHVHVDFAPNIPSNLPCGVRG